MCKMTELTGHTARVLHMAVSPDGETVVSGAADETLRFWKAFAPPEKKSRSGSAGEAMGTTKLRTIR
jgi:WD40 repeat protein